MNEPRTRQWKALRSQVCISILTTLVSFQVNHLYAQIVQLGSDIDGEAVVDLSGAAVSLSSDGSIVAIGAEQNDGNGPRSGHVRVYAFNSVDWDQMGQDIDGEATNDLSGVSVSLSADGNIVAIGAENNDGNGTESGHVRIYGYNGSDWSQLGQDIDGEAGGDRSGNAISLSADGSRVAIGAIANNGNNGFGFFSGHVRVYDFDGNSWIQLGMDIDGEAGGDRSGYSVSLSSDGARVAIGTPFNDGNGFSAGHVRVFEFDGTDWVQKGQDIDGETAGDGSGSSISMAANGTSIAIGAPSNDGGSMSNNSVGHVRVYDYNGTSWMQRGTDIDGTTIGRRLGESVSLSADGMRVAAGIPAFGPGRTRLYEFDGVDWVQLGMDIEGEAHSDRSGSAVSLSADGERLAIGAPDNNGIGSGLNGHVRVFAVDSLVTGIANLTNNENGQLRIHPNPNMGNQVTLQIPGLSTGLQHATLQIHDTYGRLVRVQTIRNNQDVDLNGELSDGLYLLTVTTGQGPYVGRLVVQQ